MASKDKRKKRRDRTGAPPSSAVGKVHVKVASADADLRASLRLVKPAVLYADRVTIYSPAATMLKAVADFAC